MSTKKCLKGLRKDKISGKCVSLEELKGRQKRSKTLKKLDKITKKSDLINEKTIKAQKNWHDNLDYKKDGNTETSESKKRQKSFLKLEKELKKIHVQEDKLEKYVGDIEEKYNISQNEQY